jgi:hypothetical protein
LRALQADENPAQSGSFFSSIRLRALFWLRRRRALGNGLALSRRFFTLNKELIQRWRIGTALLAQIGFRIPVTPLLANAVDMPPIHGVSMRARLRGKQPGHEQCLTMVAVQDIPGVGKSAVLEDPQGAAVGVISFTGSKPMIGQGISTSKDENVPRTHASRDV